MTRSVRKLLVSLMLVVFVAGFVSQSVFAASRFGHGYDCFDEFSGAKSVINSTKISTTENDWMVLGSEGFSKGTAEYTSIAVDKNNIPYVAYVDAGNDRRVTVKKYTDNGWKTVGNEGFSARKAKDTSIVFDKNNNPYVVYIEEPNSKIVVNRFVGNKWTTLGAYVGFGEDVSLAIDSKGMPYVAYTYSFKSIFFGIKNHNGLIVSKYENGKWKTEFSLGSLLKNNYYSDPSIALDACDTPYIAFNNNGINVVKVSTFGWNNYSMVHSLKRDNVKYVSLAIDKKRNPFVAFQEGKGNAAVMKYTEGEYWNISKSRAEYTSIALDGSGAPCVAYMDFENGRKATVKKYENGAWSNIGSNGFSKGNAKYTSIAVDSNDNLYVVYQDGANNKKVTVCTYSQKFVVSFNSDGGTVIADQYVPYNGKVQKPEEPIKDGYIFENWYTDSSFEEIFDFDTQVKNNTTLYAKYTKQQTANLTIKYDGNGTVSDWTYGTTKSFVLGTEIMLTAIPEQDSIFMYWKDIGGRVVSTNPEYTFEMGCDETLTAYFFEISKHLVTFKDGSGEIIKTVYIAEGEEIVFPDAPAMFGYTFIGWDKTAEEIKEAQGDIVVTALFEKLVTTVSISVYGGSGSGEYSIKDYVTVVANDPEVGQMFAQWEDDLGNVLSYNTNYGFYASRDIILTAVFVPDTEVIEEQASIAITSVTKTDDKISFVAERVVPEGNTVILHGIIVTNNSITGASETDFVIGGPDVLKGTANTKGLVGVFVLNKITEVGETWYARGFAIYKDSAGNVFTIYSGIVQETRD